MYVIIVPNFPNFALRSGILLM